MIKSSYLIYLLSLIKTKPYAEEVISRIDELKDCLYNKRIDLDKKMSQLFSYELKEKIIAFSWQEQINLHDPDSFGKFLTNLQTYIKSMPVVTIYIAVEPTDEIVKEISGWFVEKYGKNILIEPIFDKNLIGGCLVVFDQVSKDFSLKKRLEEKFKEEDWRRLMSEVRSYTPLQTNKLNGEIGNSVVNSRN